ASLPRRARPVGWRRRSWRHRGARPRRRRGCGSPLSTGLPWGRAGRGAGSGGGRRRAGVTSAWAPGGWAPGAGTPRGTRRPGARMGDVARLLAAAGQQIALDVPAGATIGGVVASGLAGPRRLRYGSPRDLLIGITVVRADGTVARSGGKVVKNVAGYDLGKL